MLTKVSKSRTLPNMAKKKKVVKKPAAKKKPVVKAKPKKVAKPKVVAKAKVKAAPKPAKVKGKAPPKPSKVVAKAPPPPVVRPEPKAKPVKETTKAKPVVVEEAPPPAEIQEEVVLTDAEGRRYCRVKDCDQLASVDSHCRYHYLLYWKKIQVRKKILTEGKLERYIEELTARYPDKFLDMLRKDLKSDKEFLAAIHELEIDESQAEGEFEDEAEPFIDEVRGMSEPAAREEEDF